MEDSRDGRLAWTNTCLIENFAWLSIRRPDLLNCLIINWTSSIDLPISLFGNKIKLPDSLERDLHLPEILTWEHAALIHLEGFFRFFIQRRIHWELIHWQLTYNTEVKSKEMEDAGWRNVFWRNFCEKFNVRCSVNGAGVWCRVARLEQLTAHNMLSNWTDRDKWQR